MSSVELADSVISFAGARSHQEPVAAGTNSLAVSIPFEVESFCARVSELSNQMDPVLLGRIISTSSKLPSVSDQAFSTLIKCLIDRIEDCQLSCLSRALFSVATSGKLKPNSGDAVRLNACAEARVMDLIRPFERIPPRALAKLCVSFASIAPGVKSADLWSRMESLASVSVTELDAEHVQQISFALSRIGTDNTLLVAQLTAKAVRLSPVPSIKTYMSLLVSLSRLPRAADDSDWYLSKKIAMDHIGLREGDCPLPALANLLSRKGGKFTDLQLRQIRVSFR